MATSDSQRIAIFGYIMSCFQGVKHISSLPSVHGSNGFASGSQGSQRQRTRTEPVCSHPNENRWFSSSVLVRTLVQD